MDTIGLLSLPNEKIIEICNNLSDSDLANLLRSNSILNDACRKILDDRKENLINRKLYIQDKINQSLINKSQIVYYPKSDTYSNVVNITFDPRENKYSLTHLVKYDDIEDILESQMEHRTEESEQAQIRRIFPACPDGGA